MRDEWRSAEARRLDEPTVSECSCLAGVSFWCRFVCGVCARRQEAGETYVQCATIYAEKLKEAHDSGVQYENAAKAFKNVNTKEALRCYNQAVDILVSSHNDGQADARACEWSVIPWSCSRGRRGGRSLHSAGRRAQRANRDWRHQGGPPLPRAPIRFSSIDRCCSLLPSSMLCSPVPSPL